MYRYSILSRLQIFRDIIFRRFLCSLIIADCLSVHPNKRSGRHLFQTKKYLIVFPRCRKRKSLPISPSRIIFLRYKRGIRFKRRMHITKQLIAISLHLPIRRNRDQRPCLIIKVLLIKIRRDTFRRITKEEFPIPV